MINQSFWVVVLTHVDKHKSYKLASFQLLAGLFQYDYLSLR